eukprot:3123277-Rhodomonas_salina.1
MGAWKLPITERTSLPPAHNRMLGLFSLKNPKRNDTERNLQLAGSDKASRQHGESEDEIQSCLLYTSDAADDM